MKRLEIDEELCKGCGLCYAVCPKKILAMGDHLNSKGFHPVICTEYDACISCGNCYRSCPDLVFTVRRPQKSA